MAMRHIETSGYSGLIRELSRIIDFKKDLPSNIFHSREVDFWFFERPLIDHIELFAGLVAASDAEFENNVLVKFSGDVPLAKSCVTFNGKDPCVGEGALSRRFSNFLEGAVGYPIVFFNETYDWVGFESAREEIGVIAMKHSKNQNKFRGYLNSNFITLEHLVEWSQRSSVESKIAKAFLDSYFI